MSKLVITNEMKDKLAIKPDDLKSATILGPGTVSIGSSDIGMGVITTSAIDTNDLYVMDTAKLRSDLRASFTVQAPMSNPNTLLSGTPAYDEPIEYDDEEDPDLCGVVVEFSDTASITSAPDNIVTPDAKAWSPFQRNSYSARVTFPSEEEGLPPRRVGVALPAGARGIKPPGEWIEEVVAFANLCLCLGDTTGCMDEDH